MTKLNRKVAAALGSSAVVLSSLALPVVASAAPVVTNASCPAQPGITPTSINWGLIRPGSGAAAAYYAGLDNALQLGIDQINATGGVNGRKIKLFVYDDAANGAQQVQMANKALTQDNVFGLSAFTGANTMYPTLKAQNVPVIGSALTAEFATDRNVISVIGPGATTMTNNVTWVAAKDAGGKSASVISHNSPSAKNGGDVSWLTMASAGLKQGVRIADVPQGAYDATSSALKIKNAGVDSIASLTFIAGGVSLLQALKQQGVAWKFFNIPNLTDPIFAKDNAAILEGVSSTTGGSAPLGFTQIPAVRTYVNGMKSRGADPYAAYGPQAYAAASLIKKGLQLAGKCPTREGVIAGIRNKVKNFDGNGLLSSKITFAPGLTPNGDPAACSWFTKIKNGVIVPDAKPTCGSIIDVATGAVVKK